MRQTLVHLITFKTYLGKVQAKNKEKYTTREVRRSSDQVGCNKTVGTMGANSKPKNQPTKRAKNLQWGKETYQ